MDNQELIKAYHEREKLVCASNPWYWLIKYCYTQDEHDEDNPYKLYPEYSYLKHVVRVWWYEKLLAIEKSRQLLGTWTIALLYLHDALFKIGRREFYQSKEFTAANNLLNRAKLTYNRLPKWMQRPKADMTEGRLLLYRDAGDRGLESDSEIMAVTMDSEALRSYTASGILADESAFQERAEQAYAACRPTVTGGGRYTALSTVNGRNFFWWLVTDAGANEEKNDRWKELQKGVHFWKNENNKFAVLRLHYTADEEKRKQEWIDREKPTVPVRRWNREMEISFESYEGQPVFGSYDSKIHFQKVNFSNLPLVYRVWDFGRRRPCCLWCAIQGIGPDDKVDRLIFLKELLGKEMLITEFAKKVLRRSKEWFPGAVFRDYGDTAGDHRNDTNQLSAINILKLQPYRILIRHKQISRDSSTDLVEQLLLQDETGMPRLIVSKECKMINEAMGGGYRYKESNTPNIVKPDILRDGLYEHYGDCVRIIAEHNFDRRLLMKSKHNNTTPIIYNGQESKSEKEEKKQSRFREVFFGR